jgi:lysophospholipase L1-like esterase
MKLSKLPFFNRRSLLQKATAASVLSAVAGSLSAEDGSTKPFELKKGTTILFQGDSITDAGRNKNEPKANDLLGRGYPSHIAGELLGKHTCMELQIHNRGISGNKVPDLAARWQQDAVDIKPDLLSILIGVNDIWHKLNGRYDGTVEKYENGYRQLLQRTKKELPNTQIVVCEPFVLKCGAVKDNWFPEFDHMREVARKLAKELNLTLVPFQTMFDEATRSASPEFWARDGVHPTTAGHALMAQTWREVVGI